MLNKNLKAINDVLFSLIPIGLAIILILILVLWIRTKEATYIQPFEIGECGVKYSGRAIADLLVAELQRIKLIHETKLPSVKTESKESSLLPSISPGSESLEYNVSNINISGGALTFSLGQILLVLNRLFGRRETTIVGSLQKYGSSNSLVAWMGSKKAGRRNAWVAEQKNDNIPQLVRDLAFMIAKDISEEKTKAKTWQGFKLFTEALENYRYFTFTGDETKLESSIENCIDASDAEVGYEDLAPLLYNLGVACFDKKKYEDAMELSQRACFIRPDAPSFLLLGASLGTLNRYEESLAASDKAIEIDPKYAGAWYNKGTALGKQGKYDEAIQAYDKAIELDPQRADTWYNKGVALGKQGKYDEAIKALDTAIEINPQNADAWYNKGVALGKQGKYDEAIQAYDKAIELDPQYANAWGNKGIYLSVQGKYDEAIKALDKAIVLDPEYSDGESYFYRGIALERVGRKTEADAAFLKAKDLGYTGPT